MEHYSTRDVEIILEMPSLRHNIKRWMICEKVKNVLHSWCHENLINFKPVRGIYISKRTRTFQIKLSKNYQRDSNFDYKD